MQFLLPLASQLSRPLIQRMRQDIAPELPLKIIAQDTYNAIGHSNLAVVSSGTATLETAVIGTPLIAVFRISNLTWIVGQYLVHVPFYSLVNLIAGKEVVPELYQREFNVDRLHAEIKKYLDDTTLRKHVRMELGLVKQRLGEGGAIERAAERICGWLES